MKLTVGDTAAATPAALQQQAREERQAEAETAIRGDDFVKNVVEQFDGRIVDGSIKPL
jgi:DNA polymerase-3 subunit gamma/tau